MLPPSCFRDHAVCGVGGAVAADLGGVRRAEHHVRAVLRRAGRHDPRDGRRLRLHVHRPRAPARLPQVSGNVMMNDQT